jgi:hypothetical protein
MLRHVALPKTDVSEELVASIFSELGTALAVASTSIAYQKTPFFIIIERLYETNSADLSLTQEEDSVTGRHLI